MAAQNEPPELVGAREHAAAGAARSRRPAHGDPELPEALVLDGPFDVAASRRLARRRDLAAVAGLDAGGAPARARAGHARARPVLRPRRQGRPAGGAHGRPRPARLRRAPPRPCRRPGAPWPSQGVTCAEVAVADALEFREGGFDRILLDPPCSGLGVLAGRPDARWRRRSRPRGGGRAPAAHARPRPRPAGAGGTARRTRCARSGATSARASSPAAARRCPTATAPTASTSRGIVTAADATVAPMRSWPQDVRVAPSILSSDFGRVREQVDRGDGGRGAGDPRRRDGRPFRACDHLRAEDGRRSWPTRSTRTAASLDVHLMIEAPERYVAQFAEAGADSITVHVETCPHLHYTLQMIREARLPGRRDAQPGDAGRGDRRGGARTPTCCSA